MNDKITIIHVISELDNKSSHSKSRATYLECQGNMFLLMYGQIVAGVHLKRARDKNSGCAKFETCQKAKKAKKKLRLFI